MSLVPIAAAYLTLGIHIVFGLSVFAFIINRAPIGINVPLERIVALIERYYREISLTVVSAATMGSLYFSEVLGWDPCPLCWYQRIFMYPMLVLFGVAIILQKDSVEDYTLPISIVGMGIAGFHYMVQMVDEVQSAGCSVADIACETTHAVHFDYITTPLMAFTAFTVVAIISYRFNGEQKD